LRAAFLVCVWIKPSNGGINADRAVLDLPSKASYQHCPASTSTSPRSLIAVPLRQSLLSQQGWVGSPKRVREHGGKADPRHQWQLPRTKGQATPASRGSDARVN
jgi:hypothetical protein